MRASHPVPLEKFIHLTWVNKLLSLHELGVYSQSISSIKPVLYYDCCPELRQTSLQAAAIAGGGSVRLPIKEERVEQICKTHGETNLFNCGNSECFPINGQLSEQADVTFLKHCGWLNKKMAHFIALNVSES